MEDARFVGNWNLICEFGYLTDVILNITNRHRFTLTVKDHYVNEFTDLKGIVVQNQENKATAELRCAADSQNYPNEVMEIHVREGKLDFTSISCGSINGWCCSTGFTRH